MLAALCGLAGAIPFLDWPKNEKSCQSKMTNHSLTFLWLLDVPIFSYKFDILLVLLNAGNGDGFRLPHFGGGGRTGLDISENF